MHGFCEKKNMIDLSNLYLENVYHYIMNF